MKQLIPFSIFFLAAVTIISSCKKDKDDKGAKTILLCTGTWKVAGFTTNPGMDWDNDGDVETDIFPYLEACEKDSYTTFAVSGTGDTNEGPIVCAGEPQIAPFVWSFGANETKLVIDGEEATLIELSTSTLKFSLPLEDGGVNYIQTFTFVH